MDHLLHLNKLKSGKNARRLLWMYEELLAKLKYKKEAYKGWKQGSLRWIQKHCLGI